MIFGEALRITGKKNKQNLRENCSKSTEMAITVCKFSKMFREACPRSPINLFCSSFCFKLILLGKTTLEKMSKFGAPSLKKSKYAPDMTRF